MNQRKRSKETHIKIHLTFDILHTMQSRSSLRQIRCSQLIRLRCLSIIIVSSVIVNRYLPLQVLCQSSNVFVRKPFVSPPTAATAWSPMPSSAPHVLPVVQSSYMTPLQDDNGSLGNALSAILFAGFMIFLLISYQQCCKPYDLNQREPKWHMEEAATVPDSNNKVDDSTLQENRDDLSLNVSIETRQNKFMGSTELNNDVNEFDYSDVEVALEPVMSLQQHFIKDEPLIQDLTMHRWYDVDDSDDDCKDDNDYCDSKLDDSTLIEDQHNSSVNGTPSTTGSVEKRQIVSGESAETDDYSVYIIEFDYSDYIIEFDCIDVEAAVDSVMPLQEHFCKGELLIQDFPVQRCQDVDGTNHDSDDNDDTHCDSNNLTLNEDHNDSSLNGTSVEKQQNRSVDSTGPDHDTTEFDCNDVEAVLESVMTFQEESRKDEPLIQDFPLHHCYDSGDNCEVDEYDHCGLSNSCDALQDNFGVKWIIYHDSDDDDESDSDQYIGPIDIDSGESVSVQSYPLTICTHYSQQCQKRDKRQRTDLKSHTTIKRCKKRKTTRRTSTKRLRDDYFQEKRICRAHHFKVLQPIPEVCDHYTTKSIMSSKII